VASLIFDKLFSMSGSDTNYRKNMGGEDAEIRAAK
jgi:hypothetical protein